MKELGREPDITTKNIDNLSADGIRFANYYVQPICTPTRSVLMSGRYSIHTGANFDCLLCPFWTEFGLNLVRFGLVTLCFDAGCEHILFGSDEPSWYVTF